MTKTINGAAASPRVSRRTDVTSGPYQGHELDLATATNAALISLLETLVAKNVLSNAEVRVLLTRAADRLAPRDYAAPAKGAVGILLDDVLPLFPENGGD